MISFRNHGVCNSNKKKILNRGKFYNKIYGIEKTLLIHRIKEFVVGFSGLELAH